jgi:hypothetical protein
MICLGGATIMPAQDTPEELQQQIDLLKKEKERLEVEKAKLDAEKALRAAKQPDDTSVSDAQKAKGQKDLLDAQKSLIDAQRALEKAQQPQDTQLDDLKKQKDLADAKKDLANSQTDALKAQLLGGVTAGSFSGAVEMKDRAGVAEANLLASHAIRIAAARIATEVKGLASGKQIFLFSLNDFPGFQRLLAFRFRKELVKQAYATAGVKASSQVALTAAAGPALFSAGLDAFSKILGFFKADFSLGGVEIKPDHSQLLFAVAGNLPDIHVPAIYNPKAAQGTVTRITEELGEWMQLRGSVDIETKKLSAQIEQLERGSDEDKKKTADLKARVELLKTVIALHDAFITSLGTPDSNGDLPIVLVAQELAIDDALQSGSTVLLVKLENAAGGYLVKKNLFTGLGAMPLYHMGGSTASYLLLEGKEGKVLAANVIPVHGGFVKAGDVQKELAKTPQ